jgi:hypothetical protein
MEFEPIPSIDELYARAFDDVDANLSHTECEQWARETRMKMLETRVEELTAALLAEQHRANTAITSLADEERAETIERLTRERNTAEANYQFMVNRAVEQTLDGYRELGQRAADAEARADLNEFGESARLRANFNSMIRALLEADDRSE